jgi:hypothetical protein
VEGDMEEEIFEGALGVGKCTRRFVTSAEKAVKFLLGQVETNQYIVVIVLKEERVGVHEVRIEEIPKDLVGVKEIIQIGKY